MEFLPGGEDRQWPLLTSWSIQGWPGLPYLASLPFTSILPKVSCLSSFCAGCWKLEPRYQLAPCRGIGQCGEATHIEEWEILWFSCVTLCKLLKLSEHPFSPESNRTNNPYSVGLLWGFAKTWGRILEIQWEQHYWPRDIGQWSSQLQHLKPKVKLWVPLSANCPPQRRTEGKRDSPTAACWVTLYCWKCALSWFSTAHRI